MRRRRLTARKMRYLFEKELTPPQLLRASQGLMTASYVCTRLGPVRASAMAMAPSTKATATAWLRNWRHASQIT